MNKMTSQTEPKTENIQDCLFPIPQASGILPDRRSCPGYRPKLFEPGPSCPTDSESKPFSFNK